MNSGGFRALFFGLVLAVGAGDQPAVGDLPSAVDSPMTIGAKHALIVCGLSGDAPHHKTFADTTATLYSALVTQLGFPTDNVRVLFGDEPQEPDAEVIRHSRRATREELTAAAKMLQDTLKPDDTLWVMVLGHSHYDGRHSWLNLPGPDIQQTDFAKLFEGLTASQQVFFIMTPTSGFYIKPLSAKHRVVITATNADYETNETEFPAELARLLTLPPPAKEFDVDQDGAATLFDLYITLTRNLAQSYLDRELLATEHALLDDNADGRGTEVQIDFLTVDQGGRVKPNRPTVPTLPAKSDGHVAKSIRLNFAQVAKQESPQP